MTKLARILAVAAVAYATPAAATNGMRMIGFGPVQDSMGGVGVGATLDASSVLSNPAGIADLGQRLDVGGAWFQPKVSYDATGIVPGMIVANDGQTIDSDRGGSPIPAIGFVRPLTSSLSSGIGVFGVAGMGVDYPTNLYGGPTLTSYLQGRFTPAVAYRVNDRISIGATANLMMAQMQYDVAAGVGQAKHDTATSFGIGATLGVKVKALPGLSVGAAWESRSWFQDFSFDVPVRENPFAPGTTIPGGTDTLAFDQPQSFTVGASWSPFARLLVAADVQWIDWSSTMGDGLPSYSSDPSATGALPFDMGWSDQWVFKVGAQIAAARGLDVRVGYDYGKMPLDPSRAFENLAFPAVSEHHVTAGAGYRVGERFAVNVAAVYSPPAKLSGSNAAPPPPMGGTGQGIASYTTEMSQLEVDLGATYRF